MRKILVADDNRVSRALIRATLEARNFAVVEACDGQDALKKIVETEPSLALLDIQMPALDGFGVLRWIRQDPRFRGLRVVAVTACAMQGDREKAIDAGFDAFITKPLDVDALRAQVEQLLSS